MYIPIIYLSINNDTTLIIHENLIFKEWLKFLNLPGFVAQKLAI